MPPKNMLKISSGSTCGGGRADGRASRRGSAGPPQQALCWARLLPLAPAACRCHGPHTAHSALLENSDRYVGTERANTGRPGKKTAAPPPPAHLVHARPVGAVPAAPAPAARHRLLRAVRVVAAPLLGVAQAAEGLGDHCARAGEKGRPARFLRIPLLKITARCSFLGIPVRHLGGKEAPPLPPSFEAAPLSWQRPFLTHATQGCITSTPQAYTAQLPVCPSFLPCQRGQALTLERLVRAPRFVLVRVQLQCQPACSAERSGAASCPVDAASAPLATLPLFQGSSFDAPIGRAAARS